MSSSWKDEIVRRREWTEGSSCEIFSDLEQSWFPGVIARVFTDKEGEWLEVIYELNSGEKMIREVQRLSSNIRSVTNMSTNDEKNIKARYELKEGSLCEAYSKPKRKWLKAMVKRVFIDDEGEWLVVLYGKSALKSVQRFSLELRIPQNNEVNSDTETTINSGPLHPNESQFQAFYNISSRKIDLAIFKIVSKCNRFKK
eukprot:522074_1